MPKMPPSPGINDAWDDEALLQELLQKIRKHGQDPKSPLHPKKNPELYRSLLVLAKQHTGMSNRAIVQELEKHGHKTNPGVVSKIINGKSTMPTAWIDAFTSFLEESR